MQAGLDAAGRGSAGLIGGGVGTVALGALGGVACGPGCAILGAAVGGYLGERVGRGLFDLGKRVFG